MKLETAIKGMLDAEQALRTPQGINNPVYMSEQMMRLSQYLGAVEEHLAQHEKEYEIEQAKQLNELLVKEKMSATAAEKHAKIAMAETKGQIAYLSRLVGSGWRQVGVIQSRINHLVREAQTEQRGVA